MSDLLPVESHGRHVIREGTEILGGVLLTRAGIVVDVEENPEPYQAILADIDRSLARSEAVSIHTILRTVKSTAKEQIPHQGDRYFETLRDEAALHDVQRLTPDHHIALSRFLGRGGICHQQSLLDATMLQLLQQRGDIEGTVNLESCLPSKVHPDRHTRVAYTAGGHDYILDHVGVHPIFDPAPDSLMLVPNSTTQDYYARGLSV
jgi:hypothetical protein